MEDRSIICQRNSYRHLIHGEIISVVERVAEMGVSLDNVYLIVRDSVVELRSFAHRDLTVPDSHVRAVFAYIREDRKIRTIDEPIGVVIRRWTGESGTTMTLYGYAEKA